jgi:lipopolysaccharide/colanic/teichoic acid biosynthesis glycosyltransferase
MPARAIDQRAPLLSANGAVPASAPTRHGGRALQASCRALDIVGATVMLVVLAPVLGVIAVLIRLDSPGPMLFRQLRLGRDAEPFMVNKFRTMHHGVAHDPHREFVLGLINGEHSQQDGENIEHESPGPRYKMIGDQRMTRFGRVLRRSSLDELPQLWNVLRGDMSLVGPRPPIPYEVEHYPPHWFARFAVKPGITGLWQVSGRSEVTLEEMVRLDVEYARRRSLWFNIVILVRTVPAVLSGRGAW